MTVSCRSQYEKMVTAKSAAVDQMYETAQVTLNSFDTEDQYIDKDTIVSIDLLSIDFQTEETEITALNYATIYHYMLLLHEYPNSILKIVGHDLKNEKLKVPTDLAKERAIEVKNRLVEGFSIPEKRILISSKSNSTCACATVKLIQPHLAFSTQLGLLKEKGDSLIVPYETTGAPRFPIAENTGTTHLNILANFLKENSTQKFEISAHTDSRGTDEANLVLSDKRANSIKDYLVNKGVKADNLQAIGRGETQPVNHCTNGVDCPDEEHEVNRRVVIKRM